MVKLPERHVPKAYIDRIFANEQPRSDDIPVVNGNSPEAGGIATESVKREEVLEFLKRDRTPKTTSPAQILAEIEGEIFSKTTLIIPRRDQPPRVVYDARRGRQVLTITSERSGLLGKWNVRKLPPQADTTNISHISVKEAFQRYNKEDVRGGLPTEKTLQKNARLTHPVKPWEHRDRTTQGGWFSKEEQQRVKRKVRQK